MALSIYFASEKTLASTFRRRPYKGATLFDLIRRQ